MQVGQKVLSRPPRHALLPGACCLFPQLPPHLNLGGGSCLRPVQMLVDVVGVVTEVRPLGSVKRKTDQVELSRRDITLVDQRWAWGTAGLAPLLGNSVTGLCQIKLCHLQVQKQ